MIVRPRKPANKSLPPNLYGPDSRGYYKYRHPRTKVDHGMGNDRRKAIEAAHILNNRFLTAVDLVDRVLACDRPLLQFLTVFENTILPEHKLSRQTLRDYKQKLRIIKDAGWAKKEPDDITVEDVSDFLDQFPATQSNRYRSLLIMIFKYVIAKGKGTKNPVASTIKRQINVKRQRLTLEGFRAVYNHADDQLKNAMDLALHTLQRREDIVEMQRPKDGLLEVVQRKTGAAIRIKVAGPLKAVIARCNDGVASPWLVHQPVQRNTTIIGNKFAPETLSRRFKAARDASGFFDEIPHDERPTFHEIRALGARLYKQCKIDPQALLGHTTEAQTKVYLSRHELQWAEVEAGLVMEQ